MLFYCNQPSEKGNENMANLFSVDGKAYQFFEKIADCMIVSILWSVFSIPVFTVGAASTALYDTVHKVIHNGSGHIWKVFWGAFKANFKQATVLWLMALLICALLGLDCYFAYILSGAYTELSWILILLIIMIAFVVMWSQYWFAYIAHIADPIKVILKNTFAMCTMHFGKSLAMLAGLAVCALLVIFLPVGPAFLLALPGGYLYFSSLLLKRIFSQYWNMES